MKSLYQLVTISILGYFGEFSILPKRQGEIANKNHYVYKVVVVLHICNRNLGILSPGYPGNKDH